jgi:hypothetical protein
MLFEQGSKLEESGQHRTDKNPRGFVQAARSSVCLVVSGRLDGDRGGTTPGFRFGADRR